MTVATELTALVQLIGTSTDERVMQALTHVHTILSALAETTATELTTVDNTIARFSGTEGAIQESSVVIDDSENMSGVGTFGCTGAATLGSTCSLGGDVTFTAAVVTPTITQTADATESVTADDMGMIAQTASGATSTGGSAFVQGGTGTSTNGAAELRDSAGTALLRAGPADDNLAALVPISMSVNDADSAPSGAAGDIAYFSNGDAGSPCLAAHNGSNWLRIALGTAVASS
jgi:hypothetical protein